MVEKEEEEGRGLRSEIRDQRSEVRDQRKLENKKKSGKLFL
jgi:hypothetical protein